MLLWKLQEQQKVLSRCVTCGMRETVMTDNPEKKRLWLFLAVTYGMTAIMSIFMFIGLKKKIDLTVFVDAQLMYPACGVILGKLLYKEDEKKLPMAGYMCVLIAAALQVLIAVLSVFIDVSPIDGGAAGDLDFWSTIGVIPIIAGSFILYILFWICGKEKAENAGLIRKKVKLSLVLILLFVLLMVAREFAICYLSDLSEGTGEYVADFVGVFKRPLNYLAFFALPFGYVFSVISFFGEEYGFRYYLQPVMQKKFGLRGGIILLSLAWAFWRLNIDFMYYSLEDGPRMFLYQVISCLALGVFLGYAYMKTENIWVPIIMHYLFDSLSVVIAGEDAVVLQNQRVSWFELPILFVASVVFMLFIFCPIFNKKKKEIPKEADM